MPTVPLVSIIPGPDAIVIISNPNPYEEAIHALWQTVLSMLECAFHFQRLSEQLEDGRLSGMDLHNARFYRMACYDLFIMRLNTLVDNRSDSWGFRQLHTAWRVHEKSAKKQAEVSAAIARLAQKVPSERDYRNLKLAHRSKSVKMNELTAPPIRIPYLAEIVNLMDMFVSGPIPYSLYLHDTMEELDLRHLLGLP